MINGPLKMLPRHFRHFHCSNFKMTCDKNFIEKLPFFNFVQASAIPPKHYVLLTVGSKLAVL